MHYSSFATIRATYLLMYIRGKMVKDSQNTFFAWLPVIVISCAAFIFNTSEFIPIALLSAIANDFGISEANAGILITMYAWVVACASLPLMIMFSKMELKRLMLGVIAFFVLSHILSALSQDFFTLMASRIGVALSHALFWSIATIMAVKVAPKGKQSLALSCIIVGTSLALSAGLPLGRIVGLYMDWRASFGCIGVAGFLVMIVFWRVFPTMPNTDSITLSTLPALIKNKPLRKIYLLTAFIITAHFTAYSYIEPFLAKCAELDSAIITFVLMLFGVMGIFAGFLFSKFYERYHRIFVFYCLFGISASLLLLHPLSFTEAGIIVLCVFWGLAIMLFNLVFQSQTIAALSMTKATAVGMSIFSGIYNVGIGGGALIGGLISENIALQGIGYIGGSIAFGACIFFIRKMAFARVFHRFVSKRFSKK